MKAKLSRRLSPQARKLVLLSNDATQVRTLVRVSPIVDVKKTRREIESLGATIHSWSNEQNLISIEVPSDKLSALADLNGVIYVEADSKFGPADSAKSKATPPSKTKPIEKAPLDSTSPIEQPANEPNEQSDSSAPSLERLGDEESA